MLWQPPSPYLEDLTKSLVVSQPARRKLQLVPPRRYPTAVSPYETLREASRVGRAQLRARLQVRARPTPARHIPPSLLALPSLSLSAASEGPLLRFVRTAGGRTTGGWLPMFPLLRPT